MLTREQNDAISRPSIRVFRFKRLRADAERAFRVFTDHSGKCFPVWHAAIGGGKGLMATFIAVVSYICRGPRLRLCELYCRRSWA